MTHLSERFVVTLVHFLCTKSDFTKASLMFKLIQSIFGLLTTNADRFFLCNTV